MIQFAQLVAILGLVQITSGLNQVWQRQAIWSNTGDIGQHLTSGGIRDDNQLTAIRCQSMLPVIVRFRPTSFLPLIIFIG